MKRFNLRDVQEGVSDLPPNEWSTHSVSREANS